MSVASNEREAISAIGGLEGAVGKLLGATPEYSAALLTAELRPNFAPDGSSFVDDVPSPTPAHAVLFVGRLMSGCPIATALRNIDDAAAGAEGVSFSVLVPP